MAEDIKVGDFVQTTQLAEQGGNVGKVIAERMFTPTPGFGQVRALTIEIRDREGRLTGGTMEIPVSAPSLRRIETPTAAKPAAGQAQPITFEGGRDVRRIVRPSGEIVHLEAKQPRDLPDTPLPAVEEKSVFDLPGIGKTKLPPGSIQTLKSGERVKSTKAGTLVSVETGEVRFESRKLREEKKLFPITTEAVPRKPKKPFKGVDVERITTSSIKHAPLDIPGRDLSGAKKIGVRTDPISGEKLDVFIVKSGKTVITVNKAGTIVFEESAEGLKDVEGKRLPQVGEVSPPTITTGKKGFATARAGTGLGFGIDVKTDGKTKFEEVTLGIAPRKSIFDRPVAQIQIAGQPAEQFPITLAPGVKFEKQPAKGVSTFGPAPAEGRFDFIAGIGQPVGGPTEIELLKRERVEAGLRKSTGFAEAKAFGEFFEPIPFVRELAQFPATTTELLAGVGVTGKMLIESPRARTEAFQQLTRDVFPKIKDVPGDLFSLIEPSKVIERVQDPEFGRVLEGAIVFGAAAVLAPIAGRAVAKRISKTVKPKVGKTVIVDEAVLTFEKVQPQKGVFRQRTPGDVFAVKEPISEFFGKPKAKRLGVAPKLKEVAVPETAFGKFQATLETPITDIFGRTTKVPLRVGADVESILLPGTRKIGTIGTPKPEVGFQFKGIAVPVKGAPVPIRGTGLGKATEIKITEPIPSKVVSPVRKPSGKPIKPLAFVEEAAAAGKITPLPASSFGIGVKTPRFSVLPRTIVTTVRPGFFSESTSLKVPVPKGVPETQIIRSARLGTTTQFPVPKVTRTVKVVKEFAGEPGEVTLRRVSLSGRDLEPIIDVKLPRERFGVIAKEVEVLTLPELRPFGIARKTFVAGQEIFQTKVALPARPKIGLGPEGFFEVGRIQPINVPLIQESLFDIAVFRRSPVTKPRAVKVQRVKSVIKFGKERFSIIEQLERPVVKPDFELLTGGRLRVRDLTVPTEFRTADLFKEFGGPLRPTDLKPKVPKRVITTSDVDVTGSGFSKARVKVLKKGAVEGSGKVIQDALVIQESQVGRALRQATKSQTAQASRVGQVLGQRAATGFRAATGAVTLPKIIESQRQPSRTISDAVPKTSVLERQGILSISSQATASTVAQTELTFPKIRIDLEPVTKAPQRTRTVTDTLPSILGITSEAVGFAPLTRQRDIAVFKELQLPTQKIRTGQIQFQQQVPKIKVPPSVPQPGPFIPEGLTPLVPGPLPFPLLVPLTGISRQKKRPRKITPSKQRRAFTPDITSIFFGITGKVDETRTFGAFERRPIPIRFVKKTKKKPKKKKRSTVASIIDSLSLGRGF